MVASIIQSDFQISYRVTSHLSVTESFINSFFNRRDIVLRDGSSNYSLFKLVSGTSLQWHQLNQYMTILPMSTRLFLMFVFGFGRDCNGLFIRYFRDTKLCLKPELTFHFIGNYIQLSFSITGKYSLGSGCISMEN